MREHLGVGARARRREQPGDVPVPEPVDRVRVDRPRAEAIGASFADTRFRAGPSSGPLFTRPLPGSPSGVVVGVVDAVGPGVDAALRGRRVAALVERDAFAEYCLAPADRLATVPGGLTAGSEPKLEFARSLGADVGVDLVLDAIGGDVLRHGLARLAPFGRAVVYGAASGELVSVPVTGLFGLRSVAGFSHLAWWSAAAERARAEIDELTGYAVDGRLRASVHAALPLADAAEAHRLLESRTTLGRVLLTL